MSVDLSTHDPGTDDPSTDDLGTGDQRTDDPQIGALSLGRQLGRRLGPAGTRRFALAAGVLVLLVIALTSLPALSSLLVAPPRVGSAVGFAAVALAVSVPLALRAPVAAILLVAAAVLAFGQLVPSGLADGPLGMVELVALLVVSWVAGQLGTRCRLAVGLSGLVGFVLVVVFGLDIDAPLILLSVGWWLIGAISRSRRRLQLRLDERVVELAHERDRYAAEAVRLERARIARELHDIVAHCMTVIVIQARAGRQLLEDAPDEVLETWTAIAATVAEAEADLDALVGMTEPDGLAESQLAALVARAEQSGSQVTVSRAGPLSDLPPSVSGLAYRVIQESLTNALRYAPGAALRIDLECRDGLRLVVTNDVPARAQLPDLGSGRGLAGLASRLAEEGLVLQWGPDRGGWRVAVEPARYPDLASPRSPEPVDGWP